MAASSISTFRRSIAAGSSSRRPARRQADPAVSGLPGFKPSEQPVLATGKVRYVGELIAVCVAPTRAEAEDIADRGSPSSSRICRWSSDMLKARAPGAPLVHEHWGDNVYLETWVEDDKIAAIARRRR